MRHELFIDNKKVDLSLSTNINLTYKSNLLSELDKITSSYSYTIKLPKTKRNMELIEGCNIPSNDSSFAYLTHRARLLRDGIEIVRDAVVVLLSVGSDIQISLTWGNVSALATFLTSDKTLQDLDLGKITWTTARTEQTPKANYGNNDAFYQPIIMVKDAMEKIFTSNSVPKEIPTDDLYDMLCMPCLTHIGKVGEITNYAATLKVADSAAEDVPSGQGAYNCNFRVVGKGVETYFDFRKTSEGRYYQYYDGFILKDLEQSVRIKGKIVVRSTGDIIRSTRLELSGIVNPIRYDWVNAEKRGGSAPGDIDVWYTYEVDSIIKGGEIVEDFVTIVFKGLSEEYSITSEMEVVITPIDERVNEIFPTAGDVEYSLSDNAPDITQIEFIKAIMSIMGWYAEPMEGDSGIRMLPYSTITDNKSKAVDWSDKLVNRRVEPSDIEFRMSDMAQKNYFRYAEDETVTGDYDGYILVDDKTLEYRKDLITLPFAASDYSIENRDENVIIPLYSYNDKGELETNGGITPRINIYYDYHLHERIGFKNMVWNKLLIRSGWLAYQSIIRQPKIITEQVRLNAIDLKLIDMTIPVYISQYGSYFAILEIKTKKYDICDVQLLKI